MSSARGLDAREYLRRYRLRDFCRHVRAWAFDRTLVVKPIFEAVAAFLGADDPDEGEDTGDEAIDAPGADEGAPEAGGKAMPAPARKLRRRRRNLPEGAIDLDGDIGPLSRAILDPYNVDAAKGWIAKHGQDDPAEFLAQGTFVELVSPQGAVRRNMG